MENLSSQQQHKPRPLQDLILSIVIPSVILMKFSGDEHLGSVNALLVALAFPLGLGLFELIRYRKFNFIALLGLVTLLAAVCVCVGVLVVAVPAFSGALLGAAQKVLLGGS